MKKKVHIENMDPNQTDYNLFYKFIETNSPTEFKEMKSSGTLLMVLEELMKKNNQFFYVGDVINLNISYTNKRSPKMIGISPEELNLYHFLVLLLF